MTVIELARQCVESLNHPDRSLPDKPLITVTGKRGGLFPKGGGPKPKRLLSVNLAGAYTHHYDAWNVLAALVAHGAIEMRAEPAPCGSEGTWALYERGAVSAEVPTAHP